MDASDFVQTEAPPALADEAPAVDEGLAPSARPNPQDYESFRANTTDFATLFSPWKLGPIELSHRIVKPAVGSDTQKNVDEMIAYYTNFVRGGVEMVWVEDFVDKYEHFSMARGLPLDEVRLLQQDSIAFAQYLQALGWDAVEINAAGNNIGQSFFSRMRNKRGDEYGPQPVASRRPLRMRLARPSNISRQ